MRNIILRLMAVALSFLVGVASYHLFFFIPYESPTLSYENPELTYKSEVQEERAAPCRNSSLRADRSILSRVERMVREKEPGWDFTPGLCTCGAMIPDEKAIILGSWERKAKNRESEEVLVEIYEAGTCEGVALWMGRLVHEELWGKWRGQKHDLGDEAYVTPPFEGHLNYTLMFRLDNLVVKVVGKSLPDVERFAKYVLVAVPAS